MARTVRALIVSAEQLNESRAGLVIVVPCTTTRRNLPSHIELDPADSARQCASECTFLVTEQL